MVVVVPGSVLEILVIQFVCVSSLPAVDRLAGLVVKASASGTEDPGFEFRL